MDYNPHNDGLWADVEDLSRSLQIKDIEDALDEMLDNMPEEERCDYVIVVVEKIRSHNETTAGFSGLLRKYAYVPATWWSAGSNRFVALPPADFNKLCAHEIGHQLFLSDLSGQLESDTANLMWYTLKYKGLKLRHGPQESNIRPDECQWRILNPLNDNAF